MIANQLSEATFVRMRKLTPELLDQLPSTDPGAIRSRNDLRRINRFMGNDEWILRQLSPDTTQITEIGAGDGNLLGKIHSRFPQIPLTALDLAPKPADMPLAIKWIQGDVFEMTGVKTEGTVIANLILHHFTDRQLSSLGKWLGEFDHIIVNEPLRSRVPAFFSKFSHPFVHPITRHDMRVSIEAGFLHDEIPNSLGLAPPHFSISQSSTWRGSQRMLASST
jgi:hypothetical protein